MTKYIIKELGGEKKHVLVSKLPRLGVSTEGDLLVWTTTR
jgi:hypothetical protein